MEANGELPFSVNVVKVESIAFDCEYEEEEFELNEAVNIKVEPSQTEETQYESTDEKSTNWDDDVIDVPEIQAEDPLRIAKPGKRPTKGRCGERFKCMECGKSYSYKISFIKHKEAHVLSKGKSANITVEKGKLPKKIHNLPAEKATASLIPNPRVKVIDSNDVELSYDVECEPATSSSLSKYSSLIGSRFVDALQPLGDYPIITGNGEQTPYDCDQCGKTFKYRTSFLKHVEIHTGNRKEKPCLLDYDSVWAIFKADKEKRAGKLFNQVCGNKLDINTQNSNQGEQACGGDSVKDPQQENQIDSSNSSQDCSRLFQIECDVPKENSHQDKQLQADQSTQDFTREIHLDVQDSPDNEESQPFDIDCQTADSPSTNKNEAADGKCPVVDVEINLDCDNNPNPKKLVTDDREMPYKCEDCGKGYRYTSSYLKHRIFHLHSGENPSDRCKVKLFQCSECEKSFASASDLKRHFMIHSGLKPYICSECGARFSQTGHLNTHQKIHTGVKTFACGECGKAFSTNSYLSLHMKIHIGIRGHICNQCPKSFHTKCDLQRHLVSHTGLKPFNCLLCGMKFTQKSHMTAHIKRHGTKFNGKR